MYPLRHSDLMELEGVYYAMWNQQSNVDIVPDQDKGDEKEKDS